MNELVNETVLIGSVGLLWVLVLFNLLLTLALVRRTSSGTQPRPQQRDWLQAGEPAPDFTAKTLDGEPVTLVSYAGRAVVFVFISPSCEPCREYVPSYNALGPVARQAERELVLVSVASRTETREFVEAFNIALPVIVAPQEESSFMKDYKFVETPTYCAIDAQGAVQSSGLPFPEKGEWGLLTASWKQADRSAATSHTGEVIHGNVAQVKNVT